MSDIVQNIISLKKQIPYFVKLVAVSKTRPVSDIIKLYRTGHRAFGENRVQEILSKNELLPADIDWHLIGHLQSNKVKFIVPFIKMIHSVDSFRLLNMINREAERIDRIVDCLLQLHIADEETKFGFSMDEVVEMISSEEFIDLRNIRVCGVMGMATFTEDQEQVREEFRYLAKCFRDIKEKFFQGEESFREISMGMSGDFKIAIEEGSTIVRIGSVIFGERNK